MTFEQAMGKMRNPIDNPRVISDRAENQRKWQDLSGMSGRAQWHWIELEEQPGSTRRTDCDPLRWKGLGWTCESGGAAA